MDADRLSGLGLFILGLYVVYEAWKLPFGTLHAPDSGFFPLALGCALILVSALIWVPTFAKGRRTEPVESIEGMPRVLVAVLALVLYTVILEAIGYLASTFFVMIVLLKGLERVRWRTTLAVALPLVVGSYVMFRWIGVPLPQGIFRLSL